MIPFPYRVSVERWMGYDDAAYFADFDAALACGVALNADGEHVEIANGDREDCEGPMWDGEDVVSHYDNGLTEEERERVEEAGL